MAHDVDITVGADTGAVRTGMEQMRAFVANTTRAMAADMEKAFAPKGLISFAILEEGIRRVVSYGAKIYDLAQRFGIGTVALQHFGNAAERNGSSLEAMAMGFNRLEVARSKALGGNDALVQSFARLNVDVEDLRNLTPEELMKRIGSSSMNAADVVKILGRNGLELRPVLQGLADDSIKLGRAMNDEAVKSAKALDDQYKQLKEDAGAFFGPVVIGLGTKSLQVIKNIGLGLAAPFSIAIQGWDKTKEQLQRFYDEQDRLAQQRDQRRMRAGQPVAGGDAGLTDDFGNLVGGATSQAETLQTRLDRLTEEHLAKQRTAEEELATLEEKRGLLQNELYIARDKETRGAAEEGEVLKAQVALAENQLEIDKVSAGISKDKADAEEKYNHEREQAAAAADQELESAQRRTRLLQLTEQFGEDIAASMEKQFELAEEIERITETINEAWAEGDEELADTLAKQREQLEIEQKLTREIDAQKKAREAYNAASKSAGQTTRAVRSGQTSINITDPRVNALLSKGYQLSEWAITMATNPRTGQVSTDELIRQIIYYNQQTQFGARNLGQYDLNRAYAINQQIIAQNAADDRAQNAAANGAQRQLASNVAGALAQGGLSAVFNIPDLAQMVDLLESIDQKLTPEVGSH